MIKRLLQQLRLSLVKDKLPQDAAVKNWLQAIFVTSVGATVLVFGVRHLKWLQPWELSAYDQILRLRPPEAPDPRMLLVTVTEEDLGSEDFSVPDNTINKLLAKLQSYQPRIIGLSIDRSKQKNLGSGLKNLDNIITYCTFSSMGSPEIPPPPNFPVDRVGFSDVIADNDGVIRRSLLFAGSSDRKCTTQYSFAALLAIKYLEKQGLEYNFNNAEHFYIGKTTFPPLLENSGGYENIDAKGYQILLNYRNPSNFARQVTLTQVLQGQIDSNWIKDRLVIIGTTARSVHPGFYTPYSASPQHPPRMPAVFIHAQVVSEMISTVLDGRHLIWYLPNWVEAVWIWGWAITGGFLAWQLRYPLRLGLAGGISLASLVGICYLFFLQGGWIPIIPPALTLLLSGVSVMAYTTYQTQQQTKVIILQVEKQKEAIEQLNTLLKETTITIQDKHIHSSDTLDQAEKVTGDFILGGRYQIAKVLASGGFGCTYIAKDIQRPGSPICVVKQLMPARRDTKFMQVARRLFDAEAEILEVLGRNRQIPELLAYFEENNEFYLVQEYISGHPLSEEISLSQDVKNESYVVEMLGGILEVLTFVHEHRVIHRDIKPSNIIRSDIDKRLVLIDFGAVKMMQPLTIDQTELATVAIGTRGYAPPEQFAGHPRLCSDIYALGMIAIQAITGIPPHELQPHPETGTVEWRHQAQINETLAAILDKMVCYHFSDRYQSAGEVLQDLKKFTG
ncbi:CHASE2 domain-containing serine/threonine-protein kinase [Chlorogloeopsis sp. ULAP01]|uniref:CHASE2 domain-containing protein n=1 Tax=Chlorogloeopsis sp. ULAP01 TaxID=3056483 RepID=UPI0025AA485C|nr:CHASE2 domain-containing serine/threonine-protein kinase [Chlorogloeopsis sp. ULAP01]MDM9379970.1 CHASE2 domain-containing serine/threonine-protein kinase [Chlorogloeopsis sp. ULAP01]